MKNAKAILLTTVLTLLTFGTVIYTSCRKDYCKNMVCQHGGTCSDGQCKCPDGYTGRFCEVANVSSIKFDNKTFTKVTVTVNGKEYLVDTGKKGLTFTGSHGDTLKGTARVKGTYGVPVDLPEFKVVFPVRGTLVHTLDVPPTHFFLMATNFNPTEPFISKVYVNYKTPGDSLLDVTQIFNDGKKYYIGYYAALDTVRVKLEKTPSIWKFDTVLSNVKNQYYHVRAF